MKKNLLFLAFLWLGFVALTQTPQGTNYQTVILDGDGQLLANTTVTLRMTIWNAPYGGTVLYRETHSKTTNTFGLVSLVIGQGTPIIGSFTKVVKGKSACYLETAVDLAGSGQYQVIGVTLLCFTSLPTADAGPNQLNLPGTTATLASNTPPTGGYGQWSIQSGTGGSIAQPGSPTSTFTGVAGNSYSLKWMVYDQNGCYAYDMVTFSFASDFVCGTSTITDVDGNVYNTLQVGSQCWMKQNLKTTKYRNGTAITFPGSNNTTWQNNTTGAYVWYNNDIANKTTYGALYNWYAVVNTNNLCPTGWHVPTDTEWTTLTTYVSSQTAYRCNSNVDYIAKSLAATTNWNTYTGALSIGNCPIINNLAANNATGFTGLPGGYRIYDFDFEDLGCSGTWWSSTEYFTYLAYSWGLSRWSSIVRRGFFNKSYGFSVRCLRD